MALERFFDIHPTGLCLVDHVFPSMAAEFRRMEREMDRMRQQMFQLLPQDPALETMQLEMQPRIVQENGANKLKLSFNVQQFKPDEVKVKIVGNNMLQVRAEHEETGEDGKVSHRAYLRQYALPKGVDVEHLQPTLTKDGVLTIEAPAPSLAPTERHVPITYHGEDAK